MWISDNSRKWDNSNEPVPLSITPREREAEKVLFTMWGYQSLRSLSRKTRHSYAHCCNYGDESSEEGGVEVTSGEESRVHRSLETSNSSSIDGGGI